MIKTKDLTKVYKILKRDRGRFSTIRNLVAPQYTEKVAVDHVSFTINDGEIVGYIGPNGAGKSTTIKMLSGILVPTSGEIEVNGLVPHIHRREHAMNIGVVFGQKTSLWWDVPVIDSYKLLRDMYKISSEQFKRNLDMFVDILDMASFINQPVRQLSLGQRMRADLAAAMIHNPDIVFLDEPTIGVDVVTKENLRLFIQEMNRERNVTVLLTTHDMADMEKMVNRVIVIGDGRVAYDGSMAGLRKVSAASKMVSISLETPCEDMELPGLTLVKASPTSKTYAFDPESKSAGELLRQISALPLPINDVTITSADIEEVIRSIYKKGFSQEVAP